MTRKKIRITVGILLAFIALMAGLFVSQKVLTKKVIDVSQFNGTLLQQPRAIKSFKLTDIDNKTFNNESLQDHWTIMFFGFTNCGYVCPTTMAELGKMYRILEEKNIKPLPQVVFITLDPDRDSLDILKKYTTAFHPNFYAARGADEVVKEMTREMGIAYSKVVLPSKENADNNYDVQHTGAIMLFNPQGELNAFFTTPHQASLLANDYELLTAAS